SPAVVLPSVGAGEVLQLRYWEWFSYACYDSGTVQISVANPTNGQWGGWVDLHSVADVSAVWSPERLDISTYAGQRVRFAFYHVATRDCCSASESSGWYVDDLEIWRGVPVLPNPEGFEGGLGDWSVDQGVWQIGVPTSGPGSAHTGSNVAATVLSGNYPAFQDSRLISPAVVLPSVGAGEVLQLRYWEWFSYSSYDSGTVQISVANPTNGQWGEWVDLHSVADVSAVWSPVR